MCGIFGVMASDHATLPFTSVVRATNALFTLSESRGKEASGLAVRLPDSIRILKEPIPAHQLIKSPGYNRVLARLAANAAQSAPVSLALIGHSRLVTNGRSELNTNNQPVVKDGAVGIHNGIIVNEGELWQGNPQLQREYEVDTEVFLGLLQQQRKIDRSIVPAFQHTFSRIQGSASVSVLFNDTNHACLGTNTGSLYLATSREKDAVVFASENFILRQILQKKYLHEYFDGGAVCHIPPGQGLLVDIATMANRKFPLYEPAPAGWDTTASAPLVPIVHEHLPAVVQPALPVHPSLSAENRAAMLHRWDLLYSGGVRLRRCTRCLLPETIPFIHFDADGVCNHCAAFDMRGSLVKGENALKDILSQFRSGKGEPDSIVGFSGGRDSCYGLYYLKHALGMHPLTFIYDWGMVTDLARRNQARVCGTLGIEQIVVSADIRKKREYIRKNLLAWLKKPDLGMVPILMAGDKKFYKYFHKIRKETGVKLFIFCGGYEGEESTGIFKLGFCGVNRNVGSAEYRMTGISLKNKLKLLWYYCKNYLTNPAYINTSLVDTLFAYYYSYLLPDDYIYLYQYLPWDEDTIVQTIRDRFDWELESDTIATWRTDDGTAALYNYIYLAMAGFTEHDTIRSQQVREGKLSRERALALVREENQPRFKSIEWYAQAVGVDVNDLISTINKAPVLYEAGPAAMEKVHADTSFSRTPTGEF